MAQKIKDESQSIYVKPVAASISYNIVNWFILWTSIMKTNELLSVKGTRVKRQRENTDYKDAD